MALEGRLLGDDAAPCRSTSRPPPGTLISRERAATTHEIDGRHDGTGALHVGPPRARTGPDRCGGGGGRAGFYGGSEGLRGGRFSSRRRVLRGCLREETSSLATLERRTVVAAGGR